MAASIAAAKGVHRSTRMEPPRQESSKRVKTSSGSTAIEVAPCLKLVVSQRSDELALEILLILPLEVQTAISTFHKF